MTSNFRRSRESGFESESNSEFLSPSQSPPNFNLKSPPSNPYEAWPKGYIFVICRVVDCDYQSQPQLPFPSHHSQRAETSTVTLSASQNAAARGRSGPKRGAPCAFRVTQARM
ncbi:hypothetical protein AVEN_273859-1 [Araneus ventricosus]|uniref:Uncharacterized protein n=1 Tax=Araneus ventricosus TaxID=182803 RepID=A0A4Y2PBQ8_ARAVE|nr:hypothetical protein AVEN_273859-1 [Araneus ventricosus]